MRRGLVRVWRAPPEGKMLAVGSVTETDIESQSHSILATSILLSSKSDKKISSGNARGEMTETYAGWNSKLRVKLGPQERAVVERSERDARVGLPHELDHMNLTWRCQACPDRLPGVTTNCDKQRRVQVDTPRGFSRRRSLRRSGPPCLPVLIQSVTRLL